jgi:hypothetical protein
MSRLTFDIHPNDFPDVYVMTGDGVCLEPHIMDGTKLFFSRTARYKSGDFVAIFKRPEFVAAGEHQVVIKKLIIAPRAEYWTAPAKFLGAGNLGAVVIAQMFNPGRVLHFDPDGLLGIHKCLGPVPAGHKTYMISDEEVLEQAAHRRRRERLLDLA